MRTPPTAKNQCRPHCYRAEFNVEQFKNEIALPTLACILVKTAFFTRVPTLKRVTVQG